MKVLIVSDNPRASSGYGKITGVWAKHLSKKGHKVMVMGSTRGALPFQPDEWQGYKIWPVEKYGNAEHIRWFLKEEKPDVVLVNTDARYIDYLFKMDNEIRQVCPLVFYHLWDELPFPEYNRPYYNCCDRIIAGSEFTHDILSERYSEGKGKLDYIPIGFDPNVYKPLTTLEVNQIRNNFNATTENMFSHVKFILGYVGRNAERKMVLSIMDAFAEWRANRPKESVDDALLYLHIPAVDCDSLEYAMRTLYRDVQIVLNRAQPSKQGDDFVNGLYNFFDVSLNRANNEGFGMPIAESMLSGTPCISIDTPGPAGLITKDTGWLLEADVMPIMGNMITPYISQRYVTNATFIRAMQEAYANRELLASKASKCRERILKHFNVRDGLLKLEDSLNVAIREWKPCAEFTVSTYPKREENLINI